MTTAESERVVEDQAEVVEKEKPYLLEVWETEESEPKARGVLQELFGG